MNQAVFTGWFFINSRFRYSLYSAIYADTLYGSVPIYACCFTLISELNYRNEILHSNIESMYWFVDNSISNIIFSYQNNSFWANGIIHFPSRTSLIAVSELDRLNWVHKTERKTSTWGTKVYVINRQRTVSCYQSCQFKLPLEI